MGFDPLFDTRLILPPHKLPLGAAYEEALRKEKAQCMGFRLPGGSASAFFEVPVDSVQPILIDGAVCDVPGNLKRRCGRDREPLLGMVFSALAVDQGDGKALIVEKGVNQLLEHVRVEIVASDGVGKLYWRAQECAVFLGVAQPLLYARCCVANFHKLLAEFPGRQFRGHGQGFQDVDVACESTGGLFPIPGSVCDGEQVGRAVEPLALFVGVEGPCQGELQNLDFRMVVKDDKEPWIVAALVVPILQFGRDVAQLAAQKEKLPWPQTGLARKGAPHDRGALHGLGQTIKELPVPFEILAGALAAYDVRNLSLPGCLTGLHMPEVEDVVVDVVQKA